MPEIYISYAWRDRETDPAPDDRETIVDKFCEAAEAKGFSIRRDKTAVGYRDSIESFMRQIGAGKYVLAVISPKYLQSEPCMFEAMRMLAHERFEERVFPIVMPDTPVFDAEKALDIRNFWREKSGRFAEKLKADGLDTSDAEFLLKLRIYKEIHENIGNFITSIARLNVLSPTVHLENGFADIFAALEKQIERDGKSEGMTSSHTLTTAPLPPEPVFQKLPLKNYSFEHVLRPAQLKFMVSRLPESLQIIGQPGQGRHRFVEDLAASGIIADVLLVRVKLTDFIKSYRAFLDVVAVEAGVTAGNDDLVEILRNGARSRQKPVLFVLENVDDMFSGKSEMDPKFDYQFFIKLNTLKTAGFAALWLSVYESVSHRMFGTQSSPLTLPAVELSQLSFEQIGAEIKRRMPELPEASRQYIQEQLETEPNHTNDLLESILSDLQSQPDVSRDVLKRLLLENRKKFVNHGRK